MTPGIFETVFSRATLDESFRAVAEAGFSSVQGHLPSSGYDPWTDVDYSATSVERMRLCGDGAGVRIAALDGAYNMAHPDAGARAAGHAGLMRIISAASQIGVPFVTLCTGTRDPNSMWRSHADNSSADAWGDCVESMARAVQVAESQAVTLLVEPEPANIVNSATKARALLDHFGSPSLKIVLDPANVVLSDRSRDPAPVLDEAFGILSQDIAFAHAKDLDAGGRFCAAGKGIVPWDRYRSLLEGIGYQGDVIFHTLTEADVVRARSVMGW